MNPLRCDPFFGNGSGDRRRQCCLVTAIVLLVMWAGGAGAFAASGPVPPFRPGERLRFVLKWTVIPAGEAVLEVMPPVQIAGNDAHHFVLTARSNAFVDAFFMVRNRIDGWSDIGVTRSLHYRQNQHEGSTRRNITVSFDWHEMRAQYSRDGQALDPIPISEGTLDPLSIFYWSRSVELVVGQPIQRSVTDGKKHVLGRATVVRRETITVPAGTFDTFLIEPDLAHVGGVFEKSPNAKIQLWVSADHRRLPVRIKSKVVVGSFSGELVNLTGTDPLFQ